MKQVTLYELLHIRLGQSGEDEEASGNEDSGAVAGVRNELLEKNRIYVDENK